MPKGIYPRTATMNTGRYLRTPWHRQRIKETNGFKGKHHTEQAKEAMREKLLGEKNGFCGKHHSEKTRQNLSALALLRIATGGYIPSFAGHHHTQESREQIGIAVKARVIGINNPMFGRTGNKNPNWRGGIAYLPYSWDFNTQLKEYIRQRDNYICQRCGVPQAECLRELSVHHINYMKDDTRATNLISLCGRCNSQVNFDRGYWQSYFEQKIAEIYIQEGGDIKDD